MFSHIAWFNEAPIEPDPMGGLRSQDQRVRRRCLAPACALEDLGIDCAVFGNLHDADPAEISTLLQKLKTDIVVVGPFSDPSLVRLAKAAKHLGCYIVADFADQTEIDEHFEKLAALSDLVVAGNEEARCLLAARNLAAVAIPDAEAGASPATEAWLACFRDLKTRPPACANTNIPPHG